MKVLIHALAMTEFCGTVRHPRAFVPALGAYSSKDGHYAQALSLDAPQRLHCGTEAFTVSTLEEPKGRSVVREGSGPAAAPVENSNLKEWRSNAV